MSLAGRTARALVGLVAAGLLAPAVASAHGFEVRADVPVPLWLFGWAAGLVLLASFVAFAVLWSRPRLERARTRAVGPPLPVWLEVLAGGIGVALFAAVVISGLAGVQAPEDNLAPTFVYVIFWVGTALASAIVGDVFRVLNPWRATARAVAWGGRGLAGRPLRAPLAYPARLGAWPAVAGIAVFGWIEIVYPDASVPSKVAWFALATAAVQWIGMALFGIEAWSARGDAFGVYFSLIARVSPLTVVDRRLRLRWPLTGLPATPVFPGILGLIVLALGTTTFDGLTNTLWWGGVSGDIGRWFFARGLSFDHSAQAASTVGWLGCIALVTAVYQAGVLGMRAVGGGESARELSRRFTHTLIPIALAYALAHYFSFLVFQGQAVAALASDPLGTGHDYLGTADWTIRFDIVGVTSIWYIQVAALIAGHVAAIALAHDRALTTWQDHRAAVRSQYCMVAVMLAYAGLGLWLLAAVAA